MTRKETAGMFVASMISLGSIIPVLFSDAFSELFRNFEFAAFGFFLIYALVCFGLGIGGKTRWRALFIYNVLFAINLFMIYSRSLQLSFVLVGLIITTGALLYSALNIEEELETETEEEFEEKYIAKRGGRLYHEEWCDKVDKIKEEDRLVFKSKKEAEEAGFKPCKECVIE
ncbi:hypothetical protein DRJ19_03250 [Candidatus Woesearchaeota archaeon]|nr:MAG: hypothetical protein DRJ19_03250 [Candidatus Woesearchaeota archaeon]